MKQRPVLPAVVALLNSIFFVGSSLAQVSVQAGGGVGVLVPTSDFGGTTIDYYAGETYGLSTGFNLAGKLRVQLQNVAFVGELGLAFPNNSGNSEPGQGRVEVSQTILTLQLGPEYHFNIPTAPLTPYVGANIAINRFSGETTFQGVSRVPSATFSVESASRFGIGFHGGVLIEVSPTIDLDAQLAYNLMNVGGRSWLDLNPTDDERLDSYIALNDERDPLFQPSDDKHFVARDRSINSFQILFSVLFKI